MVDISTLTRFMPHDWADALAACRDSVGDDYAAIGAQLRDGQAVAFHHGYGVSICRTDESELVVMCYEGTNAARAWEQFKAVARTVGADSIRFHSKRPGVGRYLARFIPDTVEPVETIYRMRLDNGR